MRFVVAVSGAKAEKTQGAMNQYNDACALASWAACVYTVAKAEDLVEDHHDLEGRAHLSLKDIYESKPGLQLYNSAAPTLAEVVQRELEGGEVAGSAEVKGRILALMERTTNFKEKVRARFAGTCVNLDGLDEDAITMGVLQVRFEQFFDESEVIVPAVAEAFASKDYDALGQLCDDSHAYTVEKLKNTIPETAWLPRWARGTAGTGAGGGEGKGADDDARTSAVALAASAFGAGFGGSCWALVPAADADAFSAEWEKAYATRFPPKEGATVRQFFVMAPAPGSFRLGD